MVLIRLAIPPCCMLLRRASSRADWVTLASGQSISWNPESSGLGHIPSRSLKLLPMLGVPSLASRPEAVDLREFWRSAARWLLRIDAPWLVRLDPPGRLLRPPELIELVDDSVATSTLEPDRCSRCRRCAAARSASKRRVALSSWAGRSRRVCWCSRAMGRNAGVSSSSSSSSRRPERWIENLPNRLNRGARLVVSSSSDSESSDELERDSSSSGGDRGKAATGGCSRLTVEGRRPKESQRGSLSSIVGVAVRVGSRDPRIWLVAVVDVKLVRRLSGAAVNVNPHRSIGSLNCPVQRRVGVWIIPRRGISF